MVDLKEKGNLKKVFLSEVLFLKNLTEESKTLFLGAASRMFWTYPCEDDLTVNKSTPH